MRRRKKKKRRERKLRTMKLNKRENESFEEGKGRDIIKRGGRKGEK